MTHNTPAPNGRPIIAPARATTLAFQALLIWAIAPLVPSSPVNAVAQQPTTRKANLQSPTTPTPAKAQQSNAGLKRIPTQIDKAAAVAEEQARLQSRRPTGEPTTVSLFGGTAAQGRSFIFLIDRSKSMGKYGLQALAAAEQELSAAVRRLQSYHQFQVIAYNDRCAYMSQRRMLAATDENKQGISKFLSALSPLGATEHEMALLSALQHQPDVIFLLTDGGDPHLSENQIRTLAERAGARTAIHCIQLGNGPLLESDTFLRRLAHEAGGTFTYADMSQPKRPGL